MKTSDDPKTSGTTFDVKQLTRVYGEGPAAVHALRGVDLQIPKGDLVVLLGASGSGKSTLLNILGGLDRATDVGCAADALPATPCRLRLPVL